MNDHNRDNVGKAYQSFNNKAVNSILSLMHPNVSWPKGWDVDYIEGHDNLRNYWTKLWSEVYINIKPLTLKENTKDQVEATFHQIVKDLQGNITSDRILKHLYTFESGLIKKMEIQKP